MPRVQIRPLFPAGTVQFLEKSIVKNGNPVYNTALEWDTSETLFGREWLLWMTPRPESFSPQ